MHAPLQVPGLAILHRDGAELKVEKITHFPQFTPAVDKACGYRGRAEAWRRPPPSEHAGGGRTMGL